MYYSYIPNTNLKVSILSLGTMTFGKQNNEKDANSQLDFGVDFGINLIDTAEIYPVPQHESTQGLSETYIGRWLLKHKQRDKIIISTKISGPPRKKNIFIRKNQILNKKNIKEALENSLRRLNTEYIDLYQVHWPQRTSNYFGELNYQYTNEQLPITILDTLEALDEHIKHGKIRYIGVSNETPWGTLKYINLAKKYNFSRIITIQNPYNLLNRSFEVGLSEICQHEKLKLLAYSPLAFGTLTGKYIQKNIKPSLLNTMRLTMFTHFKRYNNLHTKKAVAQYVQLAQKHGLNPANMALAFIRQQPFIASILLGVTNVEQLRQNLSSLNINLTKEILSSIEDIHKKFTIPAP